MKSMVLLVISGGQHLSTKLYFPLAPTIPINDFHIIVINSTTVEATWQPPSTIIGVNGDIRGYKIYVEKINGNQTIIDIVGSLNRTHLVTGLEESTTYSFSILMYTVGDGPLSVKLEVTMPNSSESTVFMVYLHRAFYEAPLF